MHRWSISLPGLPSMVPVARLFVRAFLDGSPLAGDAELIMSEYAANAIRHSAAGAGGLIQVAVTRSAGFVRIEVTDCPPGTAPPPAPGSGGGLPTLPPAAAEPASDLDESGRGLVLVDALADRWGHDGVAGGYRTAWAELRTMAAATVLPPGRPGAASG